MCRHRLLLWLRCWLAPALRRVRRCNRRHSCWSWLQRLYCSPAAGELRWARPSADLFEGRSFVDLDAAATAEDRAWIAYEAAQAERERLGEDAATRREDAESTIRALVDDVLPGSEAPEVRAAAYLKQCGQNRAWISARAEVERISSEQFAAAEPERRYRTATEDVERSEAELRRLIVLASRTTTSMRAWQPLTRV